MTRDMQGKRNETHKADVTRCSISVLIMCWMHSAWQPLDTPYAVWLTPLYALWLRPPYMVWLTPLKRCNPLASKSAPILCSVQESMRVKWYASILARHALFLCFFMRLFFLFSYPSNPQVIPQKGGGSCGKVLKSFNHECRIENSVWFEYIIPLPHNATWGNTQILTVKKGVLSEICLERPCISMQI